MVAETAAGLTIEQLTIQINAQSSLPVDAQQIKDCLRNIADDIITTGATIRHKNAA
jgi:predicted amidophosphoribosyltransferase